MTVNWDEVAALTALSTVATSAVGGALAYYVATVVDRRIDLALTQHTETVMKPLIAQLNGVMVEQARQDERLQRTERDMQEIRLHCSSVNPAQTQAGGHVPAHDAGMGY